ncbi:MAG: DUF4440 domain-containing protein [Flavobacteriales bacterium]
MKLILKVLFMSVAIASCNAPKEPDNSWEKETAKTQILKNLDQQQASWNSGDIPAFMEHYWKNDSMKFMSKKGIRYGWQKTLDGYLNSYPTAEAMGTLDFEVKELDVLSKESAYLLGSWHLLGDSLDVGGYFSLIWKKKNDKWVIVTDHTS